MRKGLDHAEGAGILSYFGIIDVDDNGDLFLEEYILGVILKSSIFRHRYRVKVLWLIRVKEC